VKAESRASVAADFSHKEHKMGKPSVSNCPRANGRNRDVAAAKKIFGFFYARPMVMLRVERVVPNALKLTERLEGKPLHLETAASEEAIF
jgi:hypothetical protein